MRDRNSIRKSRRVANKINRAFCCTFGLFFDFYDMGTCRSRGINGGEQYWSLGGGKMSFTLIWIAASAGFFDDDATGVLWKRSIISMTGEYEKGIKVCMYSNCSAPFPACCLYLGFRLVFLLFFF
jgi:hypothetical protein